MKALVVDDDRVLADIVSFTLRREGFQVVQAGDGEAALKRLAEEQPDIVILDVNLPKAVPALDGFTVCQRIREKSNIPVILLTVREDEDDIVYGFKVGADDYVLKPFSPRQLVARVQAVLRRVGASTEAHSKQAGSLSFDPDRREALVEGREPVSLTALESRLLEYLMLYPGHILTNQDLIDHIWGPGGGDRDMLRQLVRRLRMKIEPDPAQPSLIETVAGRGYGLRKTG
ncbi:MAG: response regulator transcription factor [Anaerolineales bacterium]|nr:response regulator transcription factor [Anaerolineales bacterium]